MKKSIKDYICENNEILKKSMGNVLISMKLKMSNTLLVNTAYSSSGAVKSNYPGLQYGRELRSQGDKAFIIFYGFEKEERLRKIVNASILNSEGVFYLQLPCKIEKLKELIGSIDKGKQIKRPLDESTSRAETIKGIKLLKHNLANFLGTIEPNINALRNADKLALNAERTLFIKTLSKAGRDRLDKEVEVLERIIKLGHKQLAKELAVIYGILSITNRNYKHFFDRVHEDNTRRIIDLGISLVKDIKSIKIQLEKIESGV